MSSTLTTTYSAGKDTEFEIWCDTVPQSIGTMKIVNETDSCVINYTSCMPSIDGYTISGVTFAYGDSVDYPVGSNVDESPVIDDLVDELVNDTSKTFAQKVVEFPKILGWNDELDHYESWDVVFDEEGRDTGKRINPDTQEEVQFDMDKMDAEMSHYCTLYNANTKVIPR